MDNANVNTPENGENQTSEISPELQAKLNEIQANQEALMKKSKKTGPLIAVVIVLLLVSALCIAFTVITKGRNGNNGKDVNGQSAAQTEVDLTDETAKAKIDQRIDEINLVSYNEYSKNKKGDSVLSAVFFAKKNGELFSNLGLTDKEKLYVVAANYEQLEESALENVTSADYKAEAIQKYKDQVTESDFVKYGKKLSAEKMAARYKEIFGEELKHQTIEECGANAYYSSDTGYYYFDFIGGCGGMDFRQIIIKKDTYKASDDAYYLDTTVATVYDGQDNDANDVCAIFKGYYLINYDEWNFNMKDDRVAKSCNGGETAAEFGAKIETGTKFRYAFDKEFHFKKIERL